MRHEHTVTWNDMQKHKYAYTKTNTYTETEICMRVHIHTKSGMHTQRYSYVKEDMQTR